MADVLSWAVLAWLAGQALFVIAAYIWCGRVLNRLNTIVRQLERRQRHVPPSVEQYQGEPSRLKAAWDEDDGQPE